MRRIKIFLLFVGLLLGLAGVIVCRMEYDVLGIPAIVVGAGMLSFATSDPMHLFNGKRRRR